MDDEISDDEGTTNERIEFIERMCREMSRMALMTNLPFLSFLLDMAAEEASLSNIASRVHAQPKTDQRPGLSSLLSRVRRP